MSITLTSPAWPGGSISIVVELGLPTGTGVYLFDDPSSVFDTATFGPDQTWEDVSDRVQKITTTRQCSRESGDFNGGTISLDLDNSDYVLSEENTSSPYYGLIRSGIGVRARAEVTFPDTSEATVWLFTGTVSDLDESIPSVGKRVVVSIPGRDAFEAIAAFDGYEQTPRGEGELSGPRMHRILDNLGWTGGRNIDIGVCELQATTLAQNALAEMKLVAASEGGRLWVEADGSVTFAGRYALLENPKSATPTATFSDTPTGTEFVYSAPRLKSSRDLQRTMAAYARAGGTQQLADDLTARSLFGDRRLTRTDLVNIDDPAVMALAQRDVALRAYPERRVDGITFEPLLQPSAATITAAMQWLAGLQLWHQARVLRHPTGAPFTIDRYVHVSGITHTITPDLWSIGLDFQSATVWRTFTGSLFDEATFDGTGVFTW